MIKGWSATLGIGLALLWLAGISATYTAGWLSWFDGVGALCAFAIAAGVSDQSGRSARVGTTALLSAGLFALWIIALATNAVQWQAWWTFAFGCAFVLVAMATGAQRQLPKQVLTAEQEANRERFKKSA